MKTEKQVYLPNQIFDFVLTNPYGTDEEKTKIANLLHKARIIQSRVLRRVWQVKKCSICGKKIKFRQAFVISDHKNIFHSKCRKEEI